MFPRKLRIAVSILLATVLFIGLTPAPASADPWSDFWQRLFSYLQPQQPPAPTKPTPAPTTTTTTPVSPDTRPPAGNAVKLIDFGLAPVAAGYSHDSGGPYSPGRGYGWETMTGAPLDLSSTARDRGAVSDQKLDSLIHMDAGQQGRWQLDINNGTYGLTIGTGDPSYTDSRHVIRAEGRAIVDFTPTAQTKTNITTATVTVTDNKLTLDQVGGKNTKISFIDVRTNTTTPTPPPTTAPPAPTTTVLRPVPTTTTPPAASVPGPVGGGTGGVWRNVFNDDFNGNSINRSVWPECHWATQRGCTGQNTGELQQWRPENVVVGGGVANLIARRQNVFVPERNLTMPYTSGAISTGPWGSNKPTFDFKYGYVEARIKVAPGQGLWSSFWLEPSSLSWPPEVDIVEAPNFSPNQYFVSLKYRNSTGAPTGVGEWINGPNWSQSYHTFAVEWTPTYMIWYVDGKPAYGVNDRAKIPQVPMYPIANLSVGGWAKTPPATTKFPAAMSVDYMRVWQR